MSNSTPEAPLSMRPDRKSTRLNSSHPSISYAVFCLKKNDNLRRKLHHAWSLRGGCAAPLWRACSPPPLGGRQPRCDGRCVRPEAAHDLFFLNERAPPKPSPFPLPAALPS